MVLLTREHSSLLSKQISSIYGLRITYIIFEMQTILSKLSFDEYVIIRIHIIRKRYRLNIFTQKLKEVFLSICPVFIVVILTHVFIYPLTTHLFVRFVISSILLIFGLTLFLIGVDLGISPMGQLLGPLISKSNKHRFIIIFGFFIGFLISFAEPALLIMSQQVEQLSGGVLNSTLLLVVVSIGIGTMVVVGLFRLLYNLPLYIILIISYGIIFLLSLNTSFELLAIAFDSSGVTTGILAVPFLLSLSLGITTLKKDSKSSEKDSFGLISIASAGAIIMVLLLNRAYQPNLTSATINYLNYDSVSILNTFLLQISSSIHETLLSMSPLILMGIVVSLFNRNKISKRSLIRMAMGFIYSVLGLFLFLVSINSSYIEVGNKIGNNLINELSFIPLVLFGFVIGVVTILAEPAVYVLTTQIETVTSGYIKRRSVIIALTIGVGSAIAISVLRVLIPQVQLWHFLLPGYGLALGLMFVTPKLFVGIAFDAGGVATGPMISTFILSFIHGLADAMPSADVLIDGFGMVSLVALMPIITIELLGLIFKLKSVKRGVLNG